MKHKIIDKDFVGFGADPTFFQAKRICDDCVNRLGSSCDAYELLFDDPFNNPDEHTLLNHLIQDAQAAGKCEYYIKQAK
ncbi:MAG: hypothetical protein LIO91_03655 [Bacteroidales bacterium]|nr:hypothetical protein [Bacteroidales bacterium]